MFIRFSSFILKVAHCIIEDLKSRLNVVKQRIATVTGGDFFMIGV